MKNLLIVLLVVFAIAFSSCGKKDEAKEEKKDGDKKEVVKDDILKGLVYDKGFVNQYGENLASLRLKSKAENKTAYFLNIYYKGDWKEYKKEEFKSSSEKIGKYPAIIDKSPTSVIVDVQVTPGVLISVQWRDDLLKGYDNLETMKKIASMYEMEGIEKLTGDKISGTELAKYFPKFETEQ